MSDEKAPESSSGDHQAESGSSTAENMAGDIAATFSKLSGGERLAVLGAAIVLADWLLFDLLIDKYSIGQVGFALSLLIVGAAFVHHRRKTGSDPVPYGSLLFVAAGILGLIGATDAIEEIRNDIFDRGGSTVIGALVFYAGSIVSGIGALQLRGGGN